MSKSDSIQDLLSAILECVEKGFTDKSVSHLQSRVDTASQSKEAPFPELIDALMNFMYQLQAGAVKVTASAIGLIQETHGLLQQAHAASASSLPSDLIDNLLERLDLEASGGFDEGEAGELPASARSTTVSQGTLSSANILHRLDATLATAERHLFNIPSRVPLSEILALQRQLLGQLTSRLSNERMLSASDLEGGLKAYLGTESPDIAVHEAAAFDLSIGKLLVDCLTEFTKSLANCNASSVHLRTHEDSTIATFTIDLLTNPAIQLRQQTIKQGYLNPCANIPDPDLLQFLSLALDDEPTTSVTSKSLLHRLLYALKANAIFESKENAKVQITLTIPTRTQVAEIQVLQIDGDLYGIPASSLEDFDSSPNLDDIRTNNTLTRNGQTFQALDIRERHSNQPTVAYINCGDERIGLLIDQIQTKGELVSSHVDPINHYVGGCVRLVDGRLVVLLDPDVLEVLKTNEQLLTDTKIRLCVVGEPTLANQLSRREYRIEACEYEFEACAAVQEQRPHALLLNIANSANFSTLQALSQRNSIPLLIQSDKTDFKKEMKETNVYVRSVTTLVELDDALQEISRKGPGGN